MKHAVRFICATIALSLSTANAATNLTWTGAINNIWDTSTANWTNGTTLFTDGAFVKFDDTGANTTVAVSGTPSVGGILVTNDTLTYTLNGAIAGAGANFLKTGAGLLVLGTAAGNNEYANSFGGVGSTFCLNGGTIRTSLNSAFGAAGTKLILNHGTLLTSTGSSRTFDYATEFTGAVFNLGNSGERSFNFTNAIATRFNAANVQTVNVFCASNRNISFGGGGARFDQDVVFNGNARLWFDAGLTITSNRTITINQTGGTAIKGALIGAGATLTLRGSAANVFFGSGAGNTAGDVTGLSSPTIAVDGPTVEFNRNGSTFNGGVTLLSGTVVVNGSSTASSGPLGTGPLTLIGGRITTSAGAAPTNSNPLRITGSGTITIANQNDQRFTFSGPATLTATPTVLFSNTVNPVVFTGPISLEADPTVGGNGTALFSNTVTIVGARTITALSSALNLNGPLAGTTADSLTFDVAAGQTVVLRGSGSTFAGNTIITGNGKLQTRNTGQFSPVSPLTIGAHATFDILGNSNLVNCLNVTTIGGLSGNGRVDNSNGGGGFGDNVAILVVNSITDTTFDGLIVQGNGIALVKSNSATLTLTGTNSYSLGTTVVGGKLQLNNTTGSGTGSGAVIVKDGAAVGGTGTITGHTTIETGGILAPGASAGVFHTGNLTLQNGAVYEWEFGPGSTKDSTVVNGTLMFGSTATLKLVDLGGDPTGTNILFTYTGADPVNPTWTLDFTLAPAWSGGLVSVDSVNNRVLLTAVVIPEPGTWALVGLGLLGLVLLRRPRR